MTKRYLILEEDVVDSLSSTSSTAPLSANQGKTLNESKVAIAQGVSAAGRFLAVGADGNVTAVDAPPSAVWGNITGTLSNQTDLNTALDGKLPTSKLTTGTSVPSTAGTSGDVFVKVSPHVPEGYVAIGTPAELAAFSNRVNNGENYLNAVLTADIDMAGIADFAPIGVYQTSEYRGIFDGNGHTVSNLTVNLPDSDGVGLIGYTSDGFKVMNVRCTGFTITGKNAVGALLGLYSSAVSPISIENCSVSNSTISGTNSVGGLVGSLISTYASTYHNARKLKSVNCTINASVSATSYPSGAGGVVGRLQTQTASTYDNDSFSCWYSINNIINNPSGGGGVVSMLYRAKLSNSYAYNVTINGTRNLGGIVSNKGPSGLGGGSAVINCATYGGTHGNTISASDGGAFTITNCYTSASPGVTAEVFHSQGFWDGAGVSGTTYLSWDFTDTWSWDSTANLPELRPVEPVMDTSLYAYNARAWTPLPESITQNQVTGLSAALAGKQKSITVSISEPIAAEGSDGDIWMVYSA